MAREVRSVGRGGDCRQGLTGERSGVPDLVDFGLLRLQQRHTAGSVADFLAWQGEEVVRSAQRWLPRPGQDLPRQRTLQLLSKEVSVAASPIQLYVHPHSIASVAAGGPPLRPAER